jgi:hypothetical protein
MKSRITGHNTIEACGTRRRLPGHTLAEVLAALIIGAMVLVALLGIYHRAEHSAAAVMRRLDSSRLPGEVLQRIAEDLDHVISASSDARITIENKFENVAGIQLVPAARLTLTRTIQDSRDVEQKFEEIIWQSSYDFESPAGGQVLYRSHSGITLEDKVLDKSKEDWERELFVPICSGVTFFKIEAFTGKNLVERWSGSPPPGIVVTISFAEPYKRVDGTFDVLDDEKVTRAIALDRTRKITFEIAAGPDGEGDGTAADANAPEGTSVKESVPPDSPKKAEKLTK